MDLLGLGFGEANEVTKERSKETEEGLVGLGVAREGLVGDLVLSLGEGF